MVEAGGEVRTRGSNAAGRPWQIAIERPDAVPQRAHFIVPLSGQSMATSGDYRIFFEQDGRRYSHEIDPATGAPADHRLASVTVVAADCAYADAMATALFVLGPDRGFTLAERTRDRRLLHRPRCRRLVRHPADPRLRGAGRHARLRG